MKLVRRSGAFLVWCWSFTGLAGAASPPGQFGFDEADAKQTLLQCVVHGFMPFARDAKPFKAAPAELKVSLVLGVLGWAKTYVASAEFQAAYAKMRSESKPLPPEFDGTVDDEMARRKAEIEKQIEEMKQNVAQMPPEQRQQLEAPMKEAIEATVKMQSDPEMQKIIRMGIENDRLQQRRNYEAALEQWKQGYPESPGPLLSQRLGKFLEVCGDVDFDAKLVPAGDKMRFAEPRYEQKPVEWKLCFRAGKEPVAAARDFATAWLSETAPGPASPR